MSRTARFRYALEPIRLTRQWALDALLRELGERNAACLKAQQALSRLREQLAAASAEWCGLSDSSGHLSVDRFRMLSAYMRDQEQQITAANELLADLLAQRDALIDKVVLSQRAVEAVEEHRDEMRTEFIKLRMSGEFKIADDQWNTLQARIAAHES
jgi:hypothetical protein